ncbi:MAG: hypothetical protein ABI183_01960 [Polyangiaceae bacterium]
MKQKKKNPSRRSTRGIVVAGAVSFVAFGALVGACGLDDTVIEESGGDSGRSDATILGDGAILLADGNVVSADGATIIVDSGPDTGLHVLPDGSEFDDADLSEAAVADGGCAAGSYSCTTGSSTYCLPNCQYCSGLHEACERDHICVDSCSTCADKTECFRGGGGGEHHCVENPAACASLTGNRTYCGPFLFFTIDCPGSDQVCVSSECHTCGEPSTSGDTCSPSSKGKCNGSGPTCH